MPLAIENAHKRINRIKKNHHVLNTLLKIVRSAIFAAAAISIWAILKPASDQEQITIAALTFLVSLATSTRGSSKKIELSDYLKSLEMLNPNNRKSAFWLKTNPPDSAWQNAIDQFENQFKRSSSIKVMSTASTILLPLLTIMSLGLNSPEGLDRALHSVKRAVNRLTWGASIHVIEGLATESEGTVHSLSRSKLLNLELLNPNMIEVQIAGMSEEDQAPTIELRKNSNKNATGAGNIYQSFQLSREQEKQNPQNISDLYKIAFSVTDSVDLHIPSLSKDPLATLQVKKLPVPEVSLSPVSKITEPWPDDKPLKLQIAAEARNNLQIVRLIINSGKRTSTELVHNVLSNNIQTHTSEYDLLLEPYIDSDLAEVEIYAEAIDRSVPSPLVGRSQSILLKTASAYGRYRQTLITLRKLKSDLDQKISNPEKPLAKEARENIATAQMQAADSPFFDGRDRMMINNFKGEVDFLHENKDHSRVIELSGELNDFLLEHEMLDHRERDRDFFVAIRGLSRLLEQERNSRPVEVSVITKRITKFLEDRRRIWQLRVQRISPDLQPPLWTHVRQNKPFIKALERVAALDAKSVPEANSEALVTLSKVATEYRAWIEELENAEDSSMEKAEQKRQKGIANARNELRELQKRQASISKSLDQADIQNQTALEEKWPTNRMQQNANLRATKTLEAKIRSLAPNASERIRLSIEQMNSTLSAGEDKKFPAAESYSDLAGRLLIQAQNAAQQAQRPKRQRGRRKRVAGDRYYGQSLGGEIEIRRGYQVDKRYREDILNEVQKTIEDSDNSDSQVLQKYLREVVR